ncbi:MAG: DUF2782 domain-containing protein [Gammaproteobacteria bacterium]|nr:DUF2782 domain-containing protein [Gammaproteobacteria bacterium]
MNAKATLPQQPRIGAPGRRLRRLRGKEKARRLIRKARCVKGEALWSSLALMLMALVVSTSVRAADGDIRGPDVTIIAGEERTIYEYRQGGELRMIKIVPNWGKPYFLVPRDRTTGFGDLERAEMLLPSWVLFEF